MQYLRHMLANIQIAEQQRDSCLTMMPMPSSAARFTRWMRGPMARSCLENMLAYCAAKLPKTLWGGRPDSAGELDDVL